MTRKIVPIYSATWRALIVLLSAEIAVVSVLRYVTGSEAPPPPVAANAFANPFLVIHAVAGLTTLLIGPFQFVRWVRNRWPAIHRVTGRLYLLVGAVAAPAGLVLALGTSSGQIASVGFAIPALLWMHFAWLGWRAAVERRFDAHREWMIRAYAITATAITLRLMLPASAMMELDFSSAYPVIAWASWLTNLAIAEIVIRRPPPAASAPPPVPSA